MQPSQDWLQRFSGNELLELNPKPFEQHFLDLLSTSHQAAGKTSPTFAPFIDASAYDVAWAEPRPTTRVTFICKLADREAITAVFVTGNRKELANLEPNTVRMWDNAEYGDEESGDNYWTLVVDLEQGDLIYKYTNSGGQGTWDGASNLGYVGMQESSLLAAELSMALFVQYCSRVAPMIELCSHTTSACG